MATKVEANATLLLSIRLGYFCHVFLEPLEALIDESIRTVANQSVEDLDNQMIPIMTNLLVAAKDLVSAHKVIVRVADIMMRGTTCCERSDKIQ